MRLPFVALIVCVTYIALTAFRSLALDVQDVAVVGSKPTLVSEFSQGAAVRQIFAFPRHGLRSMTFSIWSERQLTLEVELDLHRAMTGDTEPIDRVTRTLLQPAGQAWHTFEVKPVPRGTQDQILAATLRLKGVTTTEQTTRPEGTFGLMAWADDALGAGRLFVDERPRWGDLAFAAQAAPATRLERMGEALNAQVPQQLDPGRTGWLLLLALYCGVTLLVAGLAVAAASRRAQRADLAAARSSSLVSGLLLVVATVALGSGLLFARERVTVDLLRDIDRATMESPAGLQVTFGLLEESINGVMPQAVFAHPPSRLTWRLPVLSAGAALRTAIAIQRTVWHRSTGWVSDGVTFNILLQDGAATTAVYSKFINPGERLEDRAWIPVEIDLSGYAGRSISLTLETTPGPSGNPAFDWAMWAHPRIVERRSPPQRR